MKIKEIISEAAVNAYDFWPIDSAEEFTNIVEKNCSIILSAEPIYRGFQSYKPDYWGGDSSSGTRRSENTGNYYTILMDNSPYMKGWPKRSRSLICSTNKKSAGTYNQYLYAIYPYNDIKIAVCPYADLWLSRFTIPEFKLSITVSDELSDWMENLGIDDNLQSIKNAKNLPKVIYLCEEAGVDPKDFLDILQKALSPEKTGFKLLSMKQFASNRTSFEENEIWFSGDFVAHAEY